MIARGRDEVTVLKDAGHALRRLFCDTAEAEKWTRGVGTFKHFFLDGGTGAEHT